MTASMARRVNSSGEPYWACSCGRSFDVKQWADDHMDQAHRGGGRAPSQAAHMSQLKADIERAIWEARREGYARAMADAFSMLESLPATQETLDAMGRIADRLTQNDDERVQKPWLTAR